MKLLQVLPLICTTLSTPHILYYLPYPYSVYNGAIISPYGTHLPTAPYSSFTHTYPSTKIFNEPTAQYTTYSQSYPAGQPSNEQTGQTLSMRKTESKTPDTLKNAPAAQKFKPDADIFANAIKDKLETDERLKAVGDSTPTAAAALAYLSKVVDTDDLCAKPSEIYLKTIFSGKSKEEATAEATRYYIRAYNGGATIPESGACKAAELAFREAYANNEDPILSASQAFIRNWPGVQDGNPCAVSGVEYINAILDGKTHTEANTIAATSFTQSFKSLAEKGKPLKDEACAAATKAFFEALPDKAPGATGAAATAFIDKLFDDDSNAPAFDPVCLASLEAFLDSYNNGDDFEIANLKSAKAFFKAFAKGSSVPPDSACTAAAKAYTAEVQKKPSPEISAAMIAYINEAISSGTNTIDPVCAAAAEAYFDEFIETKSEEKANEAAAVAYLDALDKNPDFESGGPCAKAAQAYIDQYQ